MKLKLQFSAPLDEPEQISDVARVVGGVADGWHDWAAPDPADVGLDPYYASNPTHRELLAKSYSATTAYGPARARTVTIVLQGPVAPGGDAWPLEAAVAYLAQPLEVLVENERNDGDFFLLCWRALGSDIRRRFLVARPPVRFSQGGGKAEALALLVHRCEDAEVRGAVPPRVFVVVDSDAKYPGHVNRDTRLLLEACARFSVPIAVLRKRSIENYVGDAALHDLSNEHPEMLPAAAFLLGLTARQRDHYPIKKGVVVAGGKPALESDGERALYADVAWPSDYVAKLGRLMEHVLHNTNLTREDLVGRDAADELSDLAARLQEEI